MSVELRTLNTHEAGLATHAHAASTAHASAIDHDSVERCLGGHLILLGEQRHKLHHDSGTNGDNLVDLLTLDNLLNTSSNKALVAVAAVIGHDNHIVARGTNLILKDKKPAEKAEKVEDEANRLRRQFAQYKRKYRNILEEQLDEVDKLEIE